MKVWLATGASPGASPTPVEIAESPPPASTALLLLSRERGREAAERKGEGQLVIAGLDGRVAPAVHRAAVSIVEARLAVMPANKWSRTVEVWWRTSRRSDADRPIR
jgi:hypothetical protein